MKAADDAEKGAPAVSADQLLYARYLGIGVKLALFALALSFVVYAAGLLPAKVAVEKLPELWKLPVAEYVARTGAQQGPGAAAELLAYGDTLALASIAFLISISTLCFLLLLCRYGQRRDWMYFAIVLTEIAVVATAASGMFTAI